MYGQNISVFMKTDRKSKQSGSLFKLAYKIIVHFATIHFPIIKLRRLQLVKKHYIIWPLNTLQGIAYDTNIVLAFGYRIDILYWKSAF